MSKRGRESRKEQDSELDDSRWGFNSKTEVVENAQNLLEASGVLLKLLSDHHKSITANLMLLSGWRDR